MGDYVVFENSDWCLLWNKSTDRLRARSKKTLRDHGIACATLDAEQPVYHKVSFLTEVGAILGSAALESVGCDVKKFLGNAVALKQLRVLEKDKKHDKHPSSQEGTRNQGRPKG